MDIDIKENDILFQSPELLDKLLLDHTTKENIFWLRIIMKTWGRLMAIISASHGILSPVSMAV